MKNKKINIIILYLLLFSLTGCHFSKINDYKGIEKAEFLMGTLVTIKIYDMDETKGNKAADKALERIREIEDLMSTSLKDSEIWSINENAGKKPVTVGPDTLEVIKKGLYYGHLSKGLFDITVGPLVDLWGIGTEEAKLPERVQLENALNLVDYKDVIVNEDDMEIFLKKPGMRLDLGGIAKGYAADEAKKTLVAEGIEHAIINLGGDIQTLGKRYDEKPWNIGIKDPDEPGDGILGVIRVIDGTVVSSGDYERHFEKDGKNYHHIMDPRTGYPKEGDIRAVTIINTSSIDADALSTTIFLMGIDDGLGLIEDIDGVDAIVITDNRQVIITAGIRDSLDISKANYTIRQVGL